jgi:hypothetical protein
MRRRKKRRNTSVQCCFEIESSKHSSCQVHNLEHLPCNIETLTKVHMNVPQASNIACQLAYAMRGAGMLLRSNDQYVRAQWVLI